MSFERGPEEKYDQEQLFELLQNTENSDKKPEILNREKFEPLLKSSLAMITETKDISNLRWRTRDYVVYSRAQDYDEPPPLEKKVIYKENHLRYVFEIPDIVDPLDKTKKLSESNHMLFFDIFSLKYYRKRRIVSVKDDFDPDRDLKVLDIKRATNFGKIVGTNFEKASFDEPEGRYICQRSYNEFGSGASGYHGSVTLGYVGTISKEGHLTDAQSATKYIFATDFWFRKYRIATNIFE